MEVRYECDGCGLCCSGGLFVEADPVDVLREPRIADAALNERDRELPILDQTWLLTAGTPCPFLGKDRQCGIYATRPSCCVAFTAGASQCQGLRERAGLEPLRPVPAETPAGFIQAAFVEMEAG